MKRTSFALLAMLIVPSVSLAQLDPQDGKGIQPYGDYDFAGVGAVNVENGNLNLDLKLLSLKQAGRLPDLEIHFISDSETWQEVQTSVDLTFIPGGDQYGQPTTSRLVSNFNYAVFDFEPITYDAGGSPDNNNTDNYVYYWGVRDWKGTLHLLASEETGGATTDSIDGSGIRAPSGPSSEVYDRNGNDYLVSRSPIVKDLFGNQVVTSGSAQAPTVTDSVGRVLPTTITPSSPGCITNTFPAPPATDTVTIMVCASNHAVATHFLTEFPNNSFGAAYDYSGTLLLIDSITVANTKPWQFTYNSYGDISGITMPSGGSASFNWESYVVSGFNTSGGTSVLGRRIISKTVNDANGNVAVWNYKYDTGYVGGPTIVTDPAQNDTSHNFNSTVYPFGIEVDYFTGAYTAPAMTGGVCSGQPSAPNLVKTEFTERIPVDGTVNDGRRPDLLPTNTWTYWPSGKMAGKKTLYDFTRTYTDNQYDNLNEPDQTFSYTTGSTIETDEYDYGQCAPGTLIRQTLTNFQWQGTDSRYTSSNVLNAVSSVVVKNGSQPLAQTVNQYTDPTLWSIPTISTRGIGGDQSSTQYSYSSGTGTSGANPSGTIYQSKDGNGNITSYTYQCNGLFPLNVTNPLGQTTKYTYSCDLGRLTSVQDPNDLAANRSGTQYQYTPIGDLMSVSYPDGGGTTVDYHGYATPLNVTTTTAASTPIVRNMVYDGLGRVTQTQLASDLSTDYTDTTYDLLGRVQSISNPYRAGDSTYGITSFAYDELGRKTMQCNADNTATPTKVCTPGSSYQQWSYAENIVTFTDEVRSQWQRTTDGLGRLTRVLEPSDTSKSPTLETDYGYSPLGDLISVNQIGTSPELPRPRSFTYDSLSRLVCASNPETERTYVVCPAAATGSYTRGTVGYTYDANGNVLSRTDARGITTTYSSYDGLNRVGLKTYNDDITPSVSFTYDTSAVEGSGSLNFIGRLAQVTTKMGSSVLYNYSSAGYDPFGRPKGYTECSGTSDCTTASQYQQVGYVYDLAGNPTQVSSASSYGGVTEANQRNFTYDGASSLTSVTSAVQGGSATALFTSPTYNASGLLTSASLAVDLSSQQPAIGVTRTYDSRLRPISETDSQLPAGLSAAATVTVNISGTEQSVGGTGTATQATGTIALSYSGTQLLRATPLFVGSSITLPDGFRASFVAPSNSAVGVANALAAALNTASSPVTAVVAAGGTTSSASVALTTKTTGADQNGAIKLTLVSQVTAAPTSLAGGAGATYDTGTLAVDLNGTNLTTTYGQTSTPLTVAQGLASAINAGNLGFDATAGSPGSLTVTANQSGPADNGLPLSISSATDEPSLFSSPSFTGSSGTFSGGSDSTIYSYTIPFPGTSTTGYTPNGNLLSYTDTMNGLADAWNFRSNGASCYTPLDHLTCANATSGPWGPANGQSGLSMSWTYDSFGNRTLQGVSGSPSAPAPQTEFAKYATNNNHVTSATTAPAGFVYDDSGNVTNDGVNAYAYDGEGRLCAVLNGANTSRTGYAYDGLGNRVAKGTISSLSCNMSPTTGNGFVATANFIVGLNGEQLDELDGQGNPQHTNVYANGQLLTTYVYSQSKWFYAFNDWLGNKRVTTDAARTATETCLSLPFGDALNCSSGIDASEHHFTGKERDAETGFASGNDYFGARYYGSSTGRFLSPDWAASPVAVPYADIHNPQSLNLYSYVKNNPLSHADADGHVQLCGQSTTSTNANGDTVVNANCVDLPDPPTRMQTIQNWYKSTVVDPWNARIAAHAPPPSASRDTFGAEEIAKAMMIVAGAGWYSKYDTSITKSGSVTNVDTDVSAKSAGENLEANGYTKSTASDGTPTYTNGDTQYTIYNQSTSTGGPTAQVKINGEVVAKIRLKP